MVAKWDASDIPPQNGRRYIVTGANSGLGAATARALAAAGARVTLACRNQETANAVARDIGPAATVARLDLSDLASVREFADSVDEADVLVNNAGVMAVPFRRTVDGFEMQMGTNHLGHFVLTSLLLPKVTDRVVVVSSLMQYGSRKRFDDVNWERRTYNRWEAYGDSKLANLAFARELARRLRAAGSRKRAVIAHPGYASTSLTGKSQTRFDAVMDLATWLRVGQPAERGALPTLYAATMPDVRNGDFYGPNGPGGFRGYPTKARVRRAADDQGLRDLLWAESERLTGEVFEV
ncbi:oxidoreductase [Gordonia sp. HY002]|uniref:oxidoreductase n=1 Tax=Gordonia zhenghanii TaxID=2911516 RepID=UPI001EF153A7|nr:oxidoreductase [Gordonia zhenghanii]MCF8568882.1 oxidoreductase [Gordonia zhenghanii]MCF8602248.1 oxidoreductase [Gordonia zhenghanii]